MKICMILEGSYPYVRGGVSSWTHNYILGMPEHEFVLWVICAKAAEKGHFKYELPSNVIQVQEVALEDALQLRSDGKKEAAFTKEELQAHRALFLCGRPDWAQLFAVYQIKKHNPISFLMREEFLAILEEMCREEYPYVPFSELFYTMRSMLLPLLFMLCQTVPEADAYHATAAGYSGILGALGSWKQKKPFILTEHGIYTREREEEIIRAKWVPYQFKQNWISFFYMLSRCAYQEAVMVTSLFPRASHIQQELGCAAEKQAVVSNGIHCASFAAIPLKEPDGWTDIGAVVRIAPIKDIKTMIYAFAELEHRGLQVRMHIMGDVDDEEYAVECHQLVQQLRIQNLIFTGNVDVIAYMEKLDFTILSSVSEGQPLSVMESLCAARPCVTTEVGCCVDLLEGYGEDQLGRAGLTVPPMHWKELADAMEQLCRDPRLCREMGQIGRQRALQYWESQKMLDSYREVYGEAVRRWQESVLN